MGGWRVLMSYDTPETQRWIDFQFLNFVKENQYVVFPGNDRMQITVCPNSILSLPISGINSILWRNMAGMKILEAEITYERYLHDYSRIFGGLTSKMN